MLEFAFYPGAYTAADAVNAFFLYSLLGWGMECVVIRREKGVWENRGFVHLPLCVIYGFGCMLGFIVLCPFSSNWLVLYIASAVVATTLEYATGRVMLRTLGNLWWDYTNKRFNYQGIICLESTIGWGFVGVFLFAVLNEAVFRTVQLLPQRAAAPLAVLLCLAYALDFALSLRAALEKHRECALQEGEAVPAAQETHNERTV